MNLMVTLHMHAVFSAAQACVRVGGNATYLWIEEQLDPMSVMGTGEGNVGMVLVLIANC